MSNMHVAKSGAKTGQWVRCIASSPSSCRNGGTHISEKQATDVQHWAGRRAAADVTLQDYVDYHKSEQAGTLESTKKPLETLAEKRARLGVTGNERITKDPAKRKKQPGTKLREQFEYAEKHATPGTNTYYAYLFSGYTGWQNMKGYQLKNLAEYVANHKNSPTLAHKAVETAFAHGNLQHISADIRNNVQRQQQRITFEQASKAEIEKHRYEKAQQDAIIARVDTARTFDDSTSPVCKAANPATCPTHGVKARAQLDRLKNESSTVTQFEDYQPLNQGTPTESALLAQLQAYKGNRGLLGSVPRKTRIVEFMVHNQIQVTVENGEQVLTRKPITAYSQNFNNELSNTVRRINLMCTNGSKEKKFEETVKQFLEDEIRNETIKQTLHDEFIRTSKTELLTSVMNKGHENSDLMLRIASATKASQIHSLKKEVADFKQQDMFTAAGL